MFNSKTKQRLEKLERQYQELDTAYYTMKRDLTAEIEALKRECDILKDGLALEKTRTEQTKKASAQELISEYLFGAKGDK